MCILPNTALSVNTMSLCENVETTIDNLDRMRGVKPSLAPLAISMWDQDRPSPLSFYCRGWIGLGRQSGIHTADKNAYLQVTKIAY